MKISVAVLLGAMVLGVPQASQALVSGAGGTSLSGREGQNSNEPNEQDVTERVFSKIHTVNLKETEQANLAVQKTQNQSVRDFAQIEIADHTLAEQQLTPLAAQLNVTVRDFEPKSRSEVRDERLSQQMQQRLEELNGEEFDREFVKSQVLMHRKAISWLQEKRSLVKSVEARNYVDMQVETAIKHLKIAKMLDKQLGQK